MSGRKTSPLSSLSQHAQAPKSHEAEQAVLGAFLIDPSSWEQIPEDLAQEDFFQPEHQAIYGAMKSVRQQNRPLDLVTLAEALGSHLATVGGMTYLGQLVERTPSSRHVADYAQIVRSRSLARRLGQVAQSIYVASLDTTEKPIQEVLDEAEKAIMALSQKAGEARGFRAITPLIDEALRALDERSRNPSTVTGIPCGFADLDYMTSGLHPGDLNVLAARPSMGKTALALNIAEYVVAKHKVPTAFFSLEMSCEQLAKRLLSQSSGAKAQAMRTGYLSDEDWTRIIAGADGLRDTPLYIDDTPSVTVWDIRTRCRRLQREKGIGLIVIDYLQLINGQSGQRSHSENRATEVGLMTRGLKGLARELKVPVIVVSQLSRALEQRVNKRPMMSDLRESGAIEQDADNVLFIYRDSVYNVETPEHEKDLAEIIIGKQRSGPIGTVRLRFDGEATRFHNIAAYSQGAQDVCYDNT